MPSFSSIRPLKQKLQPADPKLTMTAQFPQKSQHRFFPDSRLQNKGEGKKENEHMFFRKLTLS